MELAYQLWSTSSELPRVVLLHGIGGTGILWRPVAVALEPYFQLLAPDQRGHGRSLLPRSSYAPQDFGQDVLDTMAETQFYPAWIVGHSMGARTAAATAYLRPAWARGLVLIDIGFSGPAGGGMGEDLYQFLRHLPLEFSSRAAARDTLTRGAPDPSMAQYLLASARARADGSLTFPFDREALLRTMEALAGFTIRPWIKELARSGMPILALRGGNSRVWSKEDFETEKAEFAAYPSVRFEEIPGTGHGLPFEKRKEFTESLLHFTGASSA